MTSIINEATGENWKIATSTNKAPHNNSLSSQAEQKLSASSNEFLNTDMYKIISDNFKNISLSKTAKID
jgi:hypothetical protein